VCNTNTAVWGGLTPLTMSSGVDMFGPDEFPFDGDKLGEQREPVLQDFRTDVRTDSRTRTHGFLVFWVSPHTPTQPPPEKGTSHAVHSDTLGRDESKTIGRHHHPQTRILPRRGTLQGLPVEIRQTLVLRYRDAVNHTHTHPHNTQQ
jgi:hypothetical protein